MSDSSPFTLVRTPDSAPSGTEANLNTANRGRVVLPTRRREIPQATEPVDLHALKDDDKIRDVVARVKKAAKAEPVDRSPRPIKAERKKLSQTALDQGNKPNLNKEQNRAGATMLPPPKRRKSAPVVEDEVQEIDPFETNAVDLPPNHFGKQGTTAKDDSSEEAPALSPASIRRAKLEAPQNVSPLPLTPRQKSVTAEFAVNDTPKPLEVADQKRKKPQQSVLPEVRNPIKKTAAADMQRWLEAEDGIQKNHTPRSDEPIESVRLKSTEPSLMSSRRIKFCCPSCNHTISMSKKFAGGKTRCPQCASAIRAPHPKYNRGTYNYEQHMEAMLHPERFSAPTASRPTFMGIPIPEAHTALIGSAAAVLVATTGFWFNRSNSSATPVAAQKQAATRTAPLTPEEEIKKEDAFAVQKQAEQIVRDYLAAEGWENKAQFVREIERVAPLMKDYYERGKSASTVVPKRVRSSAPSYYQGETLKQRRSDVIADLPDGSEAKFVVEYLPEGPRIEWESSVAYSPGSWDKILASEPSKKNPPQLLRVAACVDKYYNNEFSDDREYLSVYLEDPVTREPLGNGYVRRESEDGKRLRKFLYGSNKNNPDKIMVEVRPVENSAKERIVEITKFVKAGFRQPESTSLASVR